MRNSFSRYAKICFPPSLHILSSVLQRSTENILLLLPVTLWILKAFVRSFQPFSTALAPWTVQLIYSFQTFWLPHLSCAGGPLQTEVFEVLNSVPVPQCTDWSRCEFPVTVSHSLLVQHTEVAPGHSSLLTSSTGTMVQHVQVCPRFHRVYLT